MLSHPGRQLLPLDKFEDLSLAIFSQLKFNKLKSTLNSRDDEAKLSPVHQPPIRSSPTICG
jgi:hypothetical protein